jgi:hypothetical protein
VSVSFLNRNWLFPLVFALPFVAVPPLLFHFYPVPFWTAGEAEWIAVGNAMNMAYRLADLKMYSAIGMSGHPGVPFYYISWLALAFSGLPVAYGGDGFFNAVLGRLEQFQTINIWLAAIAGAAGILVFAREARKLVPVWVVALALLLWIGSTPWTMVAFVSPTNESFGMLINALFFCALVRVAGDEEFLPRVTIFAATVSAFAYLNKLSFINVALALVAASMLSFLFRRASVRQCVKSSALFNGVCFGIILFVGIFLIGWNEFLATLRFHKNVILGSGLYGSGNEYVVAGSAILDALKSIPADKVYCLAIAPVFGLLLVAGGFLTAAFRGREHLPAAIICVGAGTAAVLAAASVIKHYHAHYSSSVSPTLAVCLVAFYLLAYAWNYRPRLAWALALVAAIVLMTRETVPALAEHLNSKIKVNEMAQADLKDIEKLPIDKNTSIAFTYSAPFAMFGEGFVMYLACVPRLIAEYHRDRPRMFSASAPDSPPRNVGAVVIHKAYFPTVDSIIKTSSDLATFDKVPLGYREGDRIVELRTVFVLLRGARTQP